MRNIPIPTKNSSNYVYAHVLAEDKAFVDTRMAVHRINQAILKKGARYTHIPGREYKSP